MSLKGQIGQKKSTGTVFSCPSRLNLKVIYYSYEVLKINSSVRMNERRVIARYR
jgi:hypothetical protein